MELEKVISDFVNGKLIGTEHFGSCGKLLFSHGQAVCFRAEHNIFINENSPYAEAIMTIMRTYKLHMGIFMPSMFFDEAVHMFKDMLKKRYQHKASTQKLNNKRRNVARK